MAPGRNVVALVLALLASTWVGACSGTPPVASTAAPVPTPSGSAAANPSVAPSAASPSPSASVDPLDARVECPDISVDEAGVASSPRPVPTPAAGLPTPAPGHQFQAGPPPGVPPASDGRFVWAAMGEQGHVRKFDPEAGQLVARLRPGLYPRGLVEDDGRMWLAAVHRDARGGYVARIDPTTNEAEECLRIGRIGGEFLAIAGDTMWIASWTDNRIVGLDLAAKRILADLPAVEAHSIVAAEDGVWSPRHHSGIVVRIDPETLEMTEIDTGMKTSEYAALTSDAVWIGGGQGGGLVALSRSDNSVIARLPGQHIETVVAHGDTVWALDVIEDPSKGHYGRVIEIDARTREIVREYPLSGLLPVQMGIDPAGRRLFVFTDTGFLVTLDVSARE